MAHIKRYNPQRPAGANPPVPVTVYCVVVTEPSDKVGKFVKTAVWSKRRPLKGSGKVNTFFSMASFEEFCKMNKYFIREAA